MLRAAVALSLCAGAAAHGAITFPASRQGGSLAKGPGPGPGGYVNSWFGTMSGQCKLPYTNCGTFMNTILAVCASRKPWHNPGTAPIDSPCGKNAGKDGLDLPKSKMSAAHVLTPGGTIKVAYTVNQNHGGGYSWRICPASPRPTEECFQKTVLEAATDTHTLHYANGTEVTGVAAHRKMFGNQQWSRHPIPPTEMTGSFAAPCPGCRGDGRSGTGTDLSVVDIMKVPADLPKGKYVVSWRWDCQVNDQIYNQCFDAEVSDGPAPAPPSPPSPPVAATYICADNQCAAGSDGVPLATCQAVCHP